MTDLDIWQNRGAYIPFDRPVPAITSDPLASADAGLCVSYDWLPVVLTCLKSLQRPETWTGTAEDIGTACLMAQKLFGSLTEPCGGFESIPFACPYDATVSDTDWVIQSDSSLTPPEEGTWTSGVGFQAQSSVQSGTGKILRRLYVALFFTSPVTLTSLSYHFSLAKGADLPSGFTNSVTAVHVSGNESLYSIAAGADPDETDLDRTLTINPSSPVTAIYFQWTTAYSDAAIVLGSAELYDLVVNGLGTPPGPCG